MKRTGLTILPLHGGNAPHWLITRMTKLAEAIFDVLSEEYNPKKILQRLADPYWLQALSCVLGFDWHSSGTTTVTLGVLKTVLKPEKHGLIVLGGKGAKGRKVPKEIEHLPEFFNTPTSKLEQFKRASKLTAKVDTAAIQDNFQLYHHTIIVDGENWAVIQQGMDPDNRVARRYQWLSNNVKSFIEEPHTGITCNVKRDKVLDMTSHDSEECRKASLDLIKDNPKHLMKYFKLLKNPGQTTLSPLKHEVPENFILIMPRRIDWNTLKNAYETQPENYEKFLLIKGVGPATVRALSLVASLIWGAHPSWEDPVRFSFAHGGKDGVPYPVNLKRMEETAKTLKEAINASKLGKKDKLKALKSLSAYVSKQ